MKLIHKVLAFALAVMLFSSLSAASYAQALPEPLEENLELDEPTLVGSVILDSLFITVTVDTAEIVTNPRNGDTELILSVIADNQSGHDYEVCVNTAAVNGWQVKPICYMPVGARLKAKDEVVLVVSDLGISTIEDVKSLQISFIIYNGMAYYAPDAVYLTFD